MILTELSQDATPTAGDLRAAIARARVPIYVIAVELSIHPSGLSLLLNERRRLSPDMARRVAVAIHTVRQRFESNRP
jgi:plasmid maintenance system antidote protein VapI